MPKEHCSINSCNTSQPYKDTPRRQQPLRAYSQATVDGGRRGGGWARGATCICCDSELWLQGASPHITALALATASLGDSEMPGRKALTCSGSYQSLDVVFVDTLHCSFGCLLLP